MSDPLLPDSALDQRLAFVGEALGPLIGDQALGSSAAPYTDKDEGR